ncbi:MAG TPA: glycosyltransferase family 2 protein [Acidimicrobiales bacterium]|jgi:GT2 family glycosyltransferase|nr:glycosyltransferase family 2 protein [Acidimicrobiales bacterium]
MESLAPPVVAVIVAHDPGPWFEETLASLGSQTYEELSILVLDAASAEDLTARVAGVLPNAYVRRFSQNRGFGATANEATSMVDGAAYYLVCHDDVALAPDAVQFLVEEAFRSNAGIVSPKLVSWDDPGRLLEVGMTADKGGSVVGRVQPQEIDHGQHDSVRDVFVAPGGCTLIRADLFAELGGFDPAIVAMGEDLDFCWRAQVAGARIIVAPDARVRHREGLASGERALEPSLVDRVGSVADAIGALAAPEQPPGELLADSVGETPASIPVPAHRARRRGKPTVAPADAPVAAPTTLQELQRRHELLAVFKCYGRFSLFRIVPQMVFLALGEVVVAELAGNRVRARSVVRAWRWNLGRLGIIRRQRGELRGHRRLSDSEIRLQQVGGSARLSAYARRLFQHGFHGAHADELAAAAAFDAHENDGHGSQVELPPVAEGGDAVGPTERGRVSTQGILVGWVVAIIVVLIGSRGLITTGIPAIGQFAPLPGWTGVFHQFAAGWHPSGVGTTAPASPAFALLGLLGTVLLGAMGLTLKVAIFACLPLGAWGAVRLMRPFGSQRAGMVAGIAYLAVPLPYDDLALGRWGALIVYAGAPWVLTLLFRATALAPFTTSPAERIAAANRGANRRGPAARPRPRILRRVLTLGVLEAVLVSFVPAAAFVVAGVAVALLVSAALLGAWQPSIRALVTAVGATVVAAVLCLPWLIGTLTAGHGAINVLGVASAPSTAPSWGGLLRFAVGPIGASPLAWGFTAAALLPLLIGRGDRFRWASRCWSIAVVFWLLAWVIGRGWAGSLAIDPMVLLAPAAAAIVTAIGLGIAAFEEDLRSATFGWKQAATGIAAIAVVLGAFPTLVSALPGRWDLPTTDTSQAVGWMHAKVPQGAFRVLWLGDPRALNQGSWSAGEGLAYATSENGAPDATWLWNAADPGPARLLGSAVDQAREGKTNRLGELLAPAGVRYVAVVTALAPNIPGLQQTQRFPLPGDLDPALAQQLDLHPVVSQTGITVYENADWIPMRAERPTTPANRTTPLTTSLPSPLNLAPGSPIVPGLRPVLPGPAAALSYQGPLVPGTVLAAVAPAGRWQLVAPSGRVESKRPSFGWAARYDVTTSGTGTLRFSSAIWSPLGVALQIIVWLAAITALVRRRRLVDRGRRRSGRTGAQDRLPVGAHRPSGSREVPS